MHRFKKVLIVDDDKSTNFLTGKLFDRLQIADKVEMAEDGIFACDLLEKDSCPELIFLDIRMPRMDGFEFLESLGNMEICGGVKVVMLTSSVRTEDKERAFSFPHVIDYREKPLTADLVKDIVEKHFR
jgi:CheY-like chemotaxis protein